jgi:spermidine dehydrogenase
MPRRRTEDGDDRPGRARAAGEKDGITRRDFLDGAAVSAAGLAAAAAFPGLTGAEAMAHGHAGDAPLPPGYYPPTFSDPYTGEPAQVIRRTIKIDGPAAVEAVADPLHQGRPRHPRAREGHARGSTTA